MFEVLDRMLPNEDDPKSMRRWRLCNTLAAWGSLSLTLLAGSFFLTALFIGLPKVGQVAWADEMKRDRTADIKAAVEPLAKKQEATQKSLDAVVSLLEQQRIADLQRSILLAKKEQCEAVRGERNASYWTERLADLRRDYRNLTHYDADVPTDCNQL